MPSDSNSRDGWAIRRPERCYGFEEGHHTWEKYWSCCPPDTKEVIDDDFETHCYLDDAAKYSDSDSSASESNFPNQCANSSLVLWAYGESYFCCDDSLTGFVNEATSLGCAMEQDVREGENNQTMWGADMKGKPNVSPTTSSTTSSASLFSKTSSPTTSASSSSEPSTSFPSSASSSTDKGAIAGGVVGGVGGALVIAGTIWFLMRLRRRRLAGASKTDDNLSNPLQPGIHFEERNIPQPGGRNPSAELVGDPAYKELPDESRPRYELPASVAHE